MELFKIGGPNPDTNYLFMGEDQIPENCYPCADRTQAITLTGVITPSRLLPSLLL